MRKLGTRIAGIGRSIWPFKRRAERRDLVPEQPQGQLALITALDSVAASISSARTVTEVLSIIVEAAKRFTATDKVVVCLVDEYADGLVLDESTITVRGSRAAHSQEWWGPRLTEIAEDVFTDGRPYFEVDRERDAWLLAVPVRTQDQPLGIVIAINAVNHALLPEHTAFLSILGAFAAVCVANARLAEEGRYAMLAGERERIAREMHDGISQSLFSISLGMSLCKKQVFKDPASALRTLEDLEGQLTASSSEIRRLIYDLRPAKLQELGLVGSVQTWVREATRGSTVRGRIEVVGEACQLGALRESCLYRVLKEAVSNAVRHSGGSEVVVRIEYADGWVRASVKDDGDGFEASPNVGHVGSGLRNMQERMAAVDGRLSIRSGPDKGTVVEAELPIGAAS